MWHLARRLDEQGLDSAAALMARLTVDVDAVKDLAWLLYDVCKRQQRLGDSTRILNSLLTSWADLTSRSRHLADPDGQLRFDA